MLEIVLLKYWSIWPAGTKFLQDGGMWKEFKDGVFGIDKKTMAWLIEMDYAEFVKTN